VSLFHKVVLCPAAPSYSKDFNATKHKAAAKLHILFENKLPIVKKMIKKRNKRQKSR
jgi:hypothetical protein